MGIPEGYIDERALESGLASRHGLSILLVGTINEHLRQATVRAGGDPGRYRRERYNEAGDRIGPELAVSDAAACQLIEAVDLVAMALAGAVEHHPLREPS